jgi:hypothetical protein
VFEQVKTIHVVFKQKMMAKEKFPEGITVQVQIKAG